MGILRKLGAGWMRFAHVLGVVNTAILLTLVYVVVIGPMRLIGLVLRQDPLGRRPASSYWKAHVRRDGADRGMTERDRLRLQF